MKTKGFTLIEMLVVISIFTIITAVVLANFPAFRDKTALDLIAQEIATTIRQAQVYGIGTREAGASFSSYGTYFNIDLSAGGDKKSFILFADTVASEGYNSGDSLVEKFAIIGSAEIFSLTGCSDNVCTSVETLNNLNILFQRFYPEAKFIGGSGNFSYVKIGVRSTRGLNSERSINVWNTGQIVVKTI